MEAEEIEYLKKIQEERIEKRKKLEEKLIKSIDQQLDLCVKQNIAPSEETLNAIKTLAFLHSSCF